MKWTNELKNDIFDDLVMEPTIFSIFELANEQMKEEKF